MRCRSAVSRGRNSFYLCLWRNFCRSANRHWCAVRYSALSLKSEGPLLGRIWHDFFFSSSLDSLKSLSLTVFHSVPQVLAGLRVSDITRQQPNQRKMDSQRFVDLFSSISFSFFFGVQIVSKKCHTEARMAARSVAYRQNLLLSAADAQSAPQCPSLQSLHILSFFFRICAHSNTICLLLQFLILNIHVLLLCVTIEWDWDVLSGFSSESTPKPIFFLPWPRPHPSTEYPLNYFSVSCFCIIIVTNEQTDTAKSIMSQLRGSCSVWGSFVLPLAAFQVLAPCGMFVLCEIIIYENACGLHLLCMLRVMGWGTFHCMLVLWVQNWTCPDLTVPPTDRRGRWESGPEQVGGPGEEDEGHLTDHAQEDGQEARQVFLRRDGESVHFTGFLERLLFWRALSHAPHPNHILRAEAVYNSIWTMAFALSRTDASDGDLR